MPRSAVWLLTVSSLLALVVGGLLSTAAWLYQNSQREEPPALAIAFTPAPRPAGPTSVGGVTATATPATQPAAPTGAPAVTTTPAPAAATTVPVVAAANVDAGKALFTRLCNGCHPGGNAGVGPALRGAEFESEFAEDDKVKKVTREGKGAMPPFSQLTDKELGDLVAYIRTLD